MRKDITVVADARDTRGKNEARRLRVAGKVPAVVYGAGGDPVALAVSPKEVNAILRSGTGHNTIFNLSLNGGTTPVMVVAEQYEPIKGHLLHVDLKRIDLAHRLTVRVPVHVTGEAKGVKLQGGLMDVITRDVEIECLPDDIPEHYTVNVTELLMGQSVRHRDLPLGDAVKLTSDPETVIVHIVGQRGSDDVPAAEGAVAVAEPEVVKKGKKEPEAAAKDAGKGAAKDAGKGGGKDGGKDAKAKKK